MANIDVPKDIKRKVNRLMKVLQESSSLIDEITEYVESIGIDTTSDQYADSIGGRLHYAEFPNAKEFEKELGKFINA